MESFYIDLVSDASSEYFPDNRAASFITKLNQPLILQGQWTVGLVDLRYPPFLSLSERRIISYHIRNPEGSERQYQVFFYTIGNIDDPHFFKSLESNFNRWTIAKGGQQGFRMVINEFDVMQIYKPGKSKLDTEHYLLIPGFLARAFHIQDDQIRSDGMVMITETISGNKPITDLRGRIPLQLFVYTNIVSHQIVGDTMAPLLRCCSLKNNESLKEFSQILYKPVVQSFIERIELELRTEDGEFVTFKENTLSLTLHFKKQ